MALETSPFDPARYIRSPEGAAAYLESAFVSGDAAVIADALGVVARARGASQVARDSGLGRATLYQSFTAEGRPELASVVRLLAALGLRLSVAKQGEAA